MSSLKDSKSDFEIKKFEKEIDELVQKKRTKLELKVTKEDDMVHKILKKAHLDNVTQDLSTFAFFKIWQPLLDLISIFDTNKKNKKIKKGEIKNDR